jgi:cytoskeletal protein RodZ
MPNNRRPTNRSRFDVPVGKPGKPKTRRSSSQKQHPFASETNRAWLNAGIVVIATLATTILLLAISGQIYDSTNASLVAQSAAPVAGGVVNTPASQPTATSASHSPQPTRSAATPSPPKEPSPAGTPDDTEIQSAIDKRLEGDGSLSGLGITATVSDGKVILVGTAPTDEVKAKIEKLVRSVPGVRQVDNQIAVVTN